MSDANAMDSGVDIAIVGMAGRFPAASDVEALWRNILGQVEAVTELDEETLRARGVGVATLAEPGYVRKGILLDGMDRFDAAFFGYAPREAERIDPQHRLFLETAWQALEHAGYAAGQAGAPLTGVYAGSGPSLYMMRHLLPSLNLEDSDIASLLGVLNGSDPDALVSRVAYKLDLKGPAVAVQTACSTSLAAVHLACRGLLNHDADMALAGGVWLNLLQGRGYRYQPGAILSPDGHCRAFDAGAGGTAIGSGVGIVVLKRLADAVADRDTIHAVIRGSALNNDGADKVGYTAPSVAGQTAVILAAHAMADVDAGSIGYVEAHGTGTTLGDPIEVAALTDAFRASTTRQGYCALGSVKTNVGHLDAAAGVTGLIKAVMALRHAVLPPSLNFARPNPQIDFAGGPFHVNTEARPWPAEATPRRAGVSSFGMGGTNVHLVLQEPPQPPQPSPDDGADSGAVALMLSARSREALDTACRDLAAHLAEHPGMALADVAHTLRVGRKRFNHRAVAIVRDRAEAQRALVEHDPLLLLRGEAQAVPSMAFLFPGQGAQHTNMGLAMYEAGGVFRDTVDRCSALLHADLGMDLRTLLFPAPGQEADAERQLAQTALTQPALFVIEYAMAQWWIQQGVRPDAMLGHSIGEYVAACLSGVFALDDALRIVAARGRLLQATPPGAMLAVGLSEARLLAHPHPDCDVAAVNAEDKCVLSGPVEAIAQAERELGGRGVAVQRLRVSHAFHSALVDPMLAEFAGLLSRVALGEPRIPFVSNLSGRWITAEEARSPAYWVSHVRGAVRFAAGLDVLLADPGRVLLEVGPGETLASLARRHPAVDAHPVLASQCHVRRAEDNAGQPARCLARLWTAGVDVEQAPLFQQSAARRVPLPTYPFERESYWLEPAAARERTATVMPSTAGADVDDWFYTPVWRRVPPVAARDRVGGVLLLIGDAGGATEQLHRALQARGRTVVRVAQGVEFAQSGEDRFAVRPGEREDYARVLDQIGETYGAPVDICHVWNLDSAPAPEDDDRALDRGFFGLIALAQALGETGGHAVRITVVANGLEDVTGDETLSAGKATLHGACKVIPQEYPHIGCKVVDVAPPAGAALPDHIVAQIVAEVDAGDDDDAPVVAYRGPYRWTRSFEPASPSVLGMRPVAPGLRTNGVYLITGGLGGVGLAMARYLAERWQARLLLLGRGTSPAQAQTIAELEALGAQVWFRQVDVADTAQLRAAIAEATRRFGALNGVVHAAGVAGGGMIARMERSAAAKVLYPKLDGTRSLLAALTDKAPDFVLLCSSLTAITGGYGQADYCAANCFLDAVAAQAARVGGMRVVSVNWDTWREVGMAAHHRLDPGSGIDAAQAGLLLERLSSSQVPQVLVSTLPIGEQFAQARSTELADRLLPAAPAQRRSQPRPPLRNPWIEPAGDLELGLAGLWDEFLGIAAVGAEDNLFELGGDSLLAIQLLAQVRHGYGVEIHPAAFFQTPTIRALALLVEERLIEELENLGSDQTAAQHIAAPA